MTSCWKRDNQNSSWSTCLCGDSNVQKGYFTSHTKIRPMNVKHQTPLAQKSLVK